jgi:hypothetical protein
VSDVASGRVPLAAVAPASLPPELVGLSREEQSAVLAQTAKKREDLQQKIAALAEERDAFIADKVAEAGGAAGSLDQQIYDAVREQAAPAGLRYEGGPKF